QRVLQSASIFQADFVLSVLTKPVGISPSWRSVSRKVSESHEGGGPVEFVRGSDAFSTGERDEGLSQLICSYPMSYLAVVERFVSHHFPEASVAVLAGSTARGARTPSSDIDLLLLGEEIFADERTSL